MIEERIKFEEKELKPMSGWLGLLIGLILILIFPITIYFTIIKRYSISNNTRSNKFCGWYFCTLWIKNFKSK